MPFVKLDCGILNSTLWLDRECRDLFITALLMAEPVEFHEPMPQIKVRSLSLTGWCVEPGWYGFVPAAGIGIAHRAGVTRDVALLALEKLGNPESDSRTSDFDGRRLVRISGGYVVLNFMKYRDRDYTCAERARRYRLRKAARKQSTDASHRNVTPSRRNVTQAEAEAEAYINTSCGCTKPPQTAAAIVEQVLVKNVQGVDDCSKDFELSGMEPTAAMALLEREHPDIDVWGEFRKLSEKCKNQGTKPTWRGFVGWLRKASPVARIPKKPRITAVKDTPNPEQEQSARQNAARTLKEWRQSGASYQGIKSQLNSNGEVAK